MFIHPAIPRARGGRLSAGVCVKRMLIPVIAAIPFDMITSFVLSFAKKVRER